MNKNNYKDDDTQRNFEVFRQKIQRLFANHHRSRHVIFTQTDIRKMYILYMCSIHESIVYQNHKCHLCIIYDKENIIAMEVNTRFPSQDFVKSFMKHAEINAILTLRKTNTILSHQAHGMFVARFSKTSILNYSLPCFFCARLIKKYLYSFHSISFTDKNEKLIVIPSEEFQLMEFSHKSQRYKNFK